MSVDVGIFPTQDNLFTWQELRDAWQAINRTREDLPQFRANLVEIGSERVVNDEESLSMKKPYYFELGFPNTLGLMKCLNKGNLNERDYLEDAGTNLSTEAIEAYTRKWETVGYYYNLTSSGGRGIHELDLMITLSSAIADLCDGGVMLWSQGVFDPDRGIFTAEQIRAVRRLRWQR